MITKKPLPKFVPAKDLELNWPTFKGGWNNLFKPTELKPNELAQADNLMLVGEGTPTSRWGSDTYSLAGQTGRIRLLDAYVDSVAGTNYLLALTDDGYLTKKSGASYTIITGYSFASGSNLQSQQLGGNTYIAAASLNFVKFDGTSLIPYVALSSPTNVSVAQLSAASGFTTYSWLVTATSRTGETLASTNKSLASLPLDLTLTSVKVSWDTVSAASGVLQGYNIFRGFPGQETLIASAAPSSTQYIDTGTTQSFTTFPPLTNTTAGAKAKYIIKFDDRLVMAGIPGDPSRVLISGRYPNHDRFTAIDGGGYVYVSPDDGDYITGLQLHNPQSSDPVILVFKNNSVHAVTVKTLSLDNFVILDPVAHLLTSSNGASSGDTIVQVENDTFYFGRKGLFTIGQEPNFLNQIRTNEISARIRNYVQDLSDTDFREANAFYADYKYVLSFPTKKETVIYDRQRGSFMGPWKTPWGISKWLRYIDSAGTERYLAGSDSGPYIREFSAALYSDSGTAISKILRSKKEDMGNWGTFKILKLIYFLFRNVRGTVTFNLRIEDRNGNTVTSKSATITSSFGQSGWGFDPWGTQPYGESSGTVELTGDELVRYANIFKQMRVLQIEVTADGANSNFEFLGFRANAQDLGSQSLPTADRV